VFFYQFIPRLPSGGAFFFRAMIANLSCDPLVAVAWNCLQSLYINNGSDFHKMQALFSLHHFLLGGATPCSFFSHLQPI
jgi:hypothetical protein